MNEWMNEKSNELFSYRWRSASGWLLSASHRVTWSLPSSNKYCWIANCASSSSSFHSLLPSSPEREEIVVSFTNICYESFFQLMRDENRVQLDSLLEDGSLFVASFSHGHRLWNGSTTRKITDTCHKDDKTIIFLPSTEYPGGGASKSKIVSSKTQAVVISSLMAVTPRTDSSRAKMLLNVMLARSRWNIGISVRKTAH